MWNFLVVCVSSYFFFNFRKSELLACLHLAWGVPNGAEVPLFTHNALFSDTVFVLPSSIYFLHFSTYKFASRTVASRPFELRSLSVNITTVTLSRSIDLGIEATFKICFHCEIKETDLNVTSQFPFISQWKKGTRLGYLVVWMSRLSVLCWQ